MRALNRNALIKLSHLWAYKARNGKNKLMSLCQSNIGLGDLLASLRNFYLIKVMGEQDIRLRYKRSKLGPFWITISMAIMIVTIGLVFANLFKTDVKTFLPYLTLGFITWNFILNNISDSCDAFISSEGIIKQLPIPLNIYIFRILWKNFIIFLHNIVIFPFIMLFLGNKLSWQMLLVIPGFFLVIINLSWMMTVLSLICARYRDMKQITTSIMQVVFYLTPVIWMKKLLTSSTVSYLLGFNPFYICIELVRAPLLGNIPTIDNFYLAITMALVGMTLSVHMMNKYKYRVPYWV